MNTNSERVMTKQEASQTIEALKAKITALDEQKVELLERLAYMKLLTAVFFDEPEAQR